MTSDCVAHQVLPLFERVETLDLKMNFIGKAGFDALAAAILEGAAPALKTIDFSVNTEYLYAKSFSDSSALEAACKARGIRGVWMTTTGEMMHT